MDNLSMPADAGIEDNYEADTFTQSDMDSSEYRDSKRTKIIVCSITKPIGQYADVKSRHKKLKTDDGGKERDVDTIYLTDLFKQQVEENIRDIEILQDVDYQDFIENIQNNKGLKEYDKFLFVFLTHLDNTDETGISDERLHFQDKTVSVIEVQDKVKSVQALLGKPKVLLIQADYHPPIQVNQHAAPIHQREEIEEKVYKLVKIPSDSDMLVMMSNTCRPTSCAASFLVQAFGDVMRTNWGRIKDEQADFFTLTIQINVKFDELFQNVSKGRRDTPLPMVTSTMRKLFYL